VSTASIGARVSTSIDFPSQCSRLEPAARLRNNLDRIMQERGKDFFDEYVKDGPWRDYEPQLPTSENEADSDDEEPADKDAAIEEEQKPMTIEELHRMRMAVLPSLESVPLRQLEL